ncbi:MAG: glycosyltransferase family 2 protein [Prevotella sp.]|jgi:glycosyltransferase involved in cell wall biosynthesis|nr:glycosyltransferase family 2 protein [Prevotella sp.]
MTISVIIPVYKVEKYVRRCIESVIAQEYADFRIECLIIDDCSPDSSMSIVQDVINSYKGTCISFQVIHHEKNMGLSAARNSGIAAATGDYLFFIDSDDCIPEHAFSNLVSYINDYPLVDVILGNSLCLEQNSYTNAPFGEAPVLIEDKRKIFELVLNRLINRSAWSKLVRRSFVTDNDILFDVGLLYEDVTWTYKLYSCTTSILIIPELTYIYENNPTSIIHTPAERSNQLIWSFAFIADSLLKHPPVIQGKKALFVAHHLFVSHWVLIALDLFDKYGTQPDTTRYLCSVKRTLMKDAICHVRPLMILYFLVLFNPIHKLLRWKVFRNNLYRMNRFVYKFS